MEKPRPTPPPQYPPRAPAQPGARRPPPQPARPPAQTPAAKAPPANVQAPAPPPPAVQATAAPTVEYPPARAISSPHLILALGVLVEAALRLAQTVLDAKTFFTDQSHSPLAMTAQALAALGIAAGFLSLIGGFLLLIPKRLAILCVLTGAAGAVCLELGVQAINIWAYSNVHGFQFNGSVLRYVILGARMCLAPAIIFALLYRRDLRRSIKWSS